MPVTRTSSETAESDTQLILAYFNPSAPDVAILATPYKLTAVSSVTHDGPVKDWRLRIKRREGATSHLVGSKITMGTFPRDKVTVKLGQISTGKEVPVVWMGPLSCTDSEVNLGTGPVSIDSANARAISRFASQALSKQRATQSLVSLGEIGETVRMIRRPLQTLFSGLYAYLDTAKKRGRKERSTRRKNRVIQDTWLEYAFGWAPLVSDIKSNCDALARLNTYSPPSEVVASRETDNSRVTTVSQVAVPGTFAWGYKKTVTKVGMAAVRYKGCISVAESPTFTTDTLGLSLRDIIPSLWELIPYSFLVDYFTNVGSIIDANSIRSSDFRWCEKGTRVSYTKVHKPLSDFYLQSNAADYIVKSIDPQPSGDFVISVSAVERSNYSGSFVPPLQFKIPGLSTKWLNIAALATASRGASRVAARTG